MYFCRDFGKTLKKTVRKTTGLKPNKPSDRRQRYILSGRSSIRGLSPALLEEVESRPGSIYEEDPDNWSSKSFSSANYLLLYLLSACLSDSVCLTVSV